jgi:hypothetical protein
MQWLALIFGVKNRWIPIDKRVTKFTLWPSAFHVMLNLRNQAALDALVQGLHDKGFTEL